MTPTVLLFDIDGTLVTTGGVGKRAIMRTFEERYGRPDACTSFPFDGMTDRAIFRQSLANVGAKVETRLVEELIAHYIRVLEVEVKRADATKYRVHRGIIDALDRVSGVQHIAVGLGTGNVQDGARVKLSRVGIYERFTFGGFGSDHEDRIELIAAGATRGAEQLGVPLKECRVVVIGDTPKDVTAAKGAGGVCLGVGTGNFKVEELLASGAARAVDDLSVPGAVEFLLEG